MNGVIFDIKEFSLHDGPGARTTVFLKGCPLRCVWCHNPEGLSIKKQLLVKTKLCTGCGRCRQGCNHPDCREFDRCIHICPNGLISVSGRDITSKELAERLMKDAEFYKKKTAAELHFRAASRSCRRNFCLTPYHSLTAIRL